MRKKLFIFIVAMMVIAALAVVFVGCDSTSDNDFDYDSGTDDDNVTDKEEPEEEEPVIPENYDAAFDELAYFVRVNSTTSTPSKDGTSYIYTNALIVQSDQIDLRLSLMYNDDNDGKDSVGVIFYNYTNDVRNYDLSTVFNKNYEEKLNISYNLRKTGDTAEFSIHPMQYYNNSSIKDFTAEYASDIDLTTAEGKKTQYTFSALLTSSTDLFLQMMKRLCDRVGGDMTMANIGFSVYDRDGAPVKTSVMYATDETVNLGYGVSQQLEVEVFPYKSEPGKIVWDSSDTSVATVDSNGIVKGVGNGTTTITAKAGTLRVTFTVNVEKTDVLQLVEFAKNNDGKKFVLSTCNAVTNVSKDTPYISIIATEDEDGTNISVSYFENKSSYSKLDIYSASLHFTVDGTESSILEAFLEGYAMVLQITATGSTYADISKVINFSYSEGLVYNLLFTSTSFYKSLSSSSAQKYLKNLLNGVNILRIGLSKILYVNEGICIDPSYDLKLFENSESSSTLDNTAAIGEANAEVLSCVFN